MRASNDRMTARMAAPGSRLSPRQFFTITVVPTETRL